MACCVHGRAGKHACREIADLGGQPLRVTLLLRRRKDQGAATAQTPNFVCDLADGTEAKDDAGREGVVDEWAHEVPRAARTTMSGGSGP
jgi:hypothetical protein